MEKEIQMEVVFNQEHKTRNAETELSPVIICLVT